MSEAEVELRIGTDEALVLFDLLHRWLDEGHGAPIHGAVADDAELRALNGLSAALERTLVEPFRPDYARSLADARRSVNKRRGGAWPR